MKPTKRKTEAPTPITDSETFEASERAHETWKPQMCVSRTVSEKLEHKLYQTQSLLFEASSLFKEWIDDEDIRNAPKQSFSGRVYKLTHTIGTLLKKNNKPR